MEATSSLATERGAIKDSMRWFHDQGLTRLNTRNVKTYGKIAGKSVAKLAGEVGVSRPKLYQDEALITDKEIRDRLVPLVIISDLAFELFEGDETKTIHWVMAPNHLFFGHSPFEMALAGKAKSVEDTLREWLGR
ncbi:MAG: DUF2384 domain-containing protein [Proteobacteria bacterium]|jgi:hypothetical protein|nr:DUF2384 domain-containing protein [Pseudomonadota bacterium]